MAIDLLIASARLFLRPILPQDAEPIFSLLNMKSNSTASLNNLEIAFMSISSTNTKCNFKSGQNHCGKLCNIPVCLFHVSGN